MYTSIPYPTLLEYMHELEHNKEFERENDTVADVVVPHNSSDVNHVMACTSPLYSPTVSSCIIHDIASTASSAPCQPLIKFPVIYFSGKGRSFNSDWYKQHSWLEYSIQ